MACAQIQTHVSKLGPQKFLSTIKKARILIYKTKDYSHKGVTHMYKRKYTSNTENGVHRGDKAVGS